jgi:methylenetetrahydrofolate--tRNA-(uracil-5-)-methyltransferase
MKSIISIIGGGLAGSEAALQLAEAGFPVRLYEMRPGVQTPAHKTGDLAELLCSNSFKGRALTTGHGLLKVELKLRGCRLLEIAERHAIPAGDSLVVDRSGFSREVTEAIQAQSNITLVREEITEPGKLEGTVLLASGPLTSPGLAESIQRMLGGQSLYFFDAIAPIVSGESLNREIVYAGSRYGKGSPDFLNCPMEQDAYMRFYEALISARTAVIRDFETGKLFEGCLPVEEIARRGPQTLCFGPFRPVGLTHPRTGKRFYAVLQLRRENREGAMYNLVGCQTRLLYPEQIRVFSLIPGLENAEFLQFGSMHRNTYLNAPRYLNCGLQLKTGPRYSFAGQITGAEGYTEALATGLWAARHIRASLEGKEPEQPDQETAVGALIHHLVSAEPENFQPINFNFGLLAAVEGEGKTVQLKKGKEKKEFLAKRALAALAWVQ